MARSTLVLTRGEQSSPSVDPTPIGTVLVVGNGVGSKSVRLVWDNTLPKGRLRSGAEKLLQRLIQLESGK